MVVPKGIGGDVLLISSSEASEKILACCAENNWTLSVAESCTGGLLGGCLTAIPGSSAFFLGGVIAYSNSVKSSLVGVSPEIICTKGAVSSETALAMARGVTRVTGADCGISVTGIAGPEGGTPDKPVGTVWFAVVWPRGEMCRSYQFTGGRGEVREQAVQTAMDLFLEATGQGTK
jgi:PncC family amidohydrolase